VRFKQFLRGDYAAFLMEWRRDYDKSLARERQAKVVSAEDRNKEATKLAQIIFISRAVNSTKSFGIAPRSMKTPQQMLGKHPQTPNHSWEAPVPPPTSRSTLIAWRAS